MSSISPIDNNSLSNIMFPLSPMDTLPRDIGQVKPVSVDADNENNGSGSSPDFSAYYNNVHSEDFKSDIPGNFVNSANELENVMAAALENGYSVQDACNIKMAQLAYNANARVLKTTFELEI